MRDKILRIFMAGILLVIIAVVAVSYHNLEEELSSERRTCDYYLKKLSNSAVNVAGFVNNIIGVKTDSYIDTKANGDISWWAIENINGFRVNVKVSNGHLYTSLDGENYDQVI